MVLRILLFVGLGIIDEGLIVGYYKAIATQNIPIASFLTVVMGLLGYSVFKKIVFDDKNVTLFAFIAGNGIGTTITMLLFGK